MKNRIYLITGAILASVVLVLMGAVPSQTDFSTTYFRTNALPISLVGNLTNWSKLATNAVVPNTAAGVTNALGIFDGDTAKFLNGAGALSVPVGGGGGDTIWTNFVPTTTIEGNPVYGSYILNPTITRPIQIAANYITNTLDDFSTCIGLGYQLNVDMSDLATKNSEVMALGDQTLAGGSVLSNNYAIFGASHGAFYGSTILNSGRVGAYGANLTVFQSTIIGSHGIEALGSSALQASKITNSSDLWIAGHSAGGSSIWDTSYDFIVVGNSAASSQTYSGLNHVAMIGSGSLATNSNDFVFGDSAYNYFFPGASMRVEGPVSFGSNIRLGRFDSPGYPATGQIYHKSDVATGDGNFGDIFFEQYEDESNPLALRTLLDLGRSVDPAFPGIFLQVAMYTNGVPYTANMSADSGRLNLQLTKASTTLTRLSPSAHDYIANSSGVVPYLFDTDLDIVSGNVFEVRNNGALKVSLAWDGAVTATSYTAGATNVIGGLAAKAPLVSPSFTTPTLGVATATSLTMGSTNVIGALAGKATSATTLSGYGITDAAALASPALTGTPTINGQSIETQLTNRVLKAGDTMTGPLLIPAGSISAAGLAFSGNAGSGLYAPNATTDLRIAQNGVDVVRFVSGTSIVWPTGLAVGWGSSTVTSQDVFIGRDSAATTQFGQDSATPIAQTLKAADGSGTDKAGANFTIEGGQGTGTGAGGDLIEKTSITSTTGSTAQTYSTRRYVRAKPTTLTESSATAVANITLASGKYVMIHVKAATFASDGTDHQTTADAFTVTAVNKGGTITVSSPSTSLTSTAPSTGTLTTTWTLVANGSTSVDLKNNAVSSLTQTTLQTLWELSIESNDPATVTPQ